MKFTRAAIASAASLIVLASAQPATARQEPAGVRNAVYWFDMPAQPAHKSLMVVAKQSGAAVIFDPREVGELRSPAVKGNLSVTAALQRIIGRSGLPIRQTGADVYVVGGLRHRVLLRRRPVHWAENAAASRGAWSTRRPIAIWRGRSSR